MQKLRVDGTLGGHHLWSGSYIGRCPGVGKTAEETVRERVEWDAIIRG